ncbi:hypothetical protein OG462_05225 [Streptomyces sp. NBC_01077]|uniref:hypothetical protein n=1 Tax=Streptomyces sp. NBC_01077 TaxID=2903746 RepID=UPI00386B1387|nr:hypothetical protein OG462_05225 [Streptomyces sp. NBC_01077]
MGRSARRLATLLPAILCAIWSLLVLPASAAAPATGATSHTVPASAMNVTPAPAHRASAPEPHFAPTAVVRLPAAVENPVRIPVAPPATAAVPADLSVPARGVLAGDPRRERAPPGAVHDPRAPRGPPSTRHS